MARGLVSNSMRAIGVLTSDIRNYHFAQTATTLENLFFGWGYSTVLCNTGNKSEKKRDYIQILAEKKVDGIVLIGSVFTGIEIETTIEKYLPYTPIVIANSSLSLANVHSVLIDHDRGLELAVSHLVERGHTGILFVSTSETYNSRRKIASFHQAMGKHGLPVEGTVVNTSFGLDGANKLMDWVIEFSPKTTAMIFADDNTAFCSVKYLRGKKMRVPDDMAVIGYDNSFYSLYADPPLTSIDTRNETFSTLVANMMHDILEDAAVGSSMLLSPEIVIRGST
jgi:LacI family transcriptional regulator